MTSDVKKYSITVFGTEYTLVSDDPEQHVIEAADRVDDLMNQIAAKVPDMETEHIAVLAALRIASHLVQLESETDMIQSVLEQISESIEHDMPNTSS